MKTLKLVTIGSAIVITVVCIKYRPAYKVTISGETIGYVENLELIENKVEFEEEYSFSDLFYLSQQNPLCFDFVFKKDGLVIGLLEYNGKQHYEPIEFFGGVDNFIIQQKRDYMKLEYCKSNQIPLFIIK